MAEEGGIEDGLAAKGIRRLERRLRRDKLLQRFVDRMRPELSAAKAGRKTTEMSNGRTPLFSLFRSFTGPPSKTGTEEKGQLRGGRFWALRVIAVEGRLWGKLG